MHGKCPSGACPGLPMIRTLNGLCNAMLTGSTTVLRPSMSSAHQEQASPKRMVFQHWGMLEASIAVLIVSMPILECLHGSLGTQLSPKFYKLKNTYSKPILG